MTATLTRRSFRHTAIASIAAGFIVAAVAAPAAAQTTKTTFNGTSASLESYDNSCTGTWLSVSRSKTTAGTETLINYSIWDYCAGANIAYGYGRIANADFKVSGKAAKLVTDLTYDPNFYFQGASGRIELTWAIDAQISDRYDGSWDMRRPGERIRQKGVSESNAASASGMIVGRRIDDAPGSVGTTRNMSVEITR